MAQDARDRPGGRAALGPRVRATAADSSESIFSSFRALDLTLNSPRLAPALVGGSLWLALPGS